MFCQKCGSQIPAGKNFCMSCGTPVNGQSGPSYSHGATSVTPTGNNQVRYERPQYREPDPSVNVGSILAMGIVALAISFMPLGSIAAIILGSMAMRRGNDYRMHGYTPSGKVNTGRALGIAGMICGIVMTVIWSIYFISLISLCASGCGRYSYYYY